MTANIDSGLESEESDDKSIGVRFAESSVGAPIVSGLLFITDSAWLTLTAFGVLIVLVAVTLTDGVMAGILGVFGLSGILFGLVGYVAYHVIVYRRDERS